MSDLFHTKPKLLVIGDALKDVYIHGSWSPRNGALRFKPNDILEFEGGAANTLANARAILGNKAEVISWMNKDPLYLYRFIDHEVRESYIQIADHNSLRLPSVLHKSYMQGIIISDYNKGTVNKSAPHFIPIAPWIIVDSRYRSVHPDYLNLAQYRIWRCTGDEFDEEWAKQFNLVVHTNGSDRIRLIDSPSPVENRTCIFEFTVPVIDPIDTCGAGDTFTAMLGAQLLLGKEVKDSIPLCIKAAQEVCMKKYTAITTEKL